MKQLWFKILIAGFTFAIGVGSAYLAWSAYKHPVDVPPLHLRADSPGPVMNVATAPDTRSVKEEWEELVALGGCTLGRRYYSPQFDTYEPDEGGNPEAGIFYRKRWVAFFRRDKKETVPFLISQIPSKAKTSVHIDPLGNAQRGELAVYCLQYILKVNWYELKKEYQGRFDSIDYEYSTDQELLQRTIGTKRGAKEMMGLWQAAYERAS